MGRLVPAFIGTAFGELLTCAIATERLIATVTPIKHKLMMVQYRALAIVISLLAALVVGAFAFVNVSFTQMVKGTCGRADYIHAKALFNLSTCLTTLLIYAIFVCVRRRTVNHSTLRKKHRQVC